MSPYEIAEMNERIAERRRRLGSYARVPIRPPSWAGHVVDIDGELVAIHRETATPYPLDLHSDLSPEDRAIVIGRRILDAGGTVDEVVRFVGAFNLPQHARDRLTRQVREV